MTWTPLPNQLPSLSARDACIDAIHRFTEGIDENNTDIFRSAFISDAVFDLSIWSKKPDEIQGIESIIARFQDSVFATDTLHQVTNLRVFVDEQAGTAWLTAYALAQHKRTGEGQDPAADELLNGNRYEVELVRETDAWLIKRFTLKNKWARGNPAVFMNQK